MDENSNILKLTRALDRLRACAEGPQTKVCLTSEDCREVCAYIWWLTDKYAKEKRQGGRDEDRIVQD